MQEEKGEKGEEEDEKMEWKIVLTLPLPIE
jgi:hypothetical protein